MGDVMSKYRIEVDESTCIGCGVCEGVCADNWQLAEKGGAYKGNSKKAEVDDLGCNMDAAENCPVTCIHITETTSGKKLI